MSFLQQVLAPVQDTLTQLVGAGSTKLAGLAADEFDLQLEPVTATAAQQTTADTPQFTGSGADRIAAATADRERAPDEGRDFPIMPVLVTLGGLGLVFALAARG